MKTFPQTAFDYTYDISKNSIVDRFNVKFKPISREVLPWKEELILSAKKIRESTDKPICILMSGGIDSEAVARIFMEANISFSVLTIKHTEGTNSHDTSYADAFCNKYNIKQYIEKIDIQSFLTTGIDNYIKQGYRSVNIYHYLQLFILETLEKKNVYGVGGAGEQVYFNVNNEACVKINPHYTLGMDWCRNNNADHQLWFNLNNPELYASWLKLDLIDYLLKDPSYFTNHPFRHASIEKILIYHKYWPEMIPRNKATGFERIQFSIRTPKEQELSLLFPDLVNLYIPVNIIKNQLGI